MAKPFVNLNPNAAARSAAAPPIGMWSAIRNRDPPFSTHFFTVSISLAVNADGVGRYQFSTLILLRALAITSILISLSRDSLNLPGYPLTTYPSLLSSLAKGRYLPSAV